MDRPIYRPENCAAAYQLNWSYSLFWHRTPTDFAWFDELKALNEKDHIRLLQHQFKPPNVSQFLVSTPPPVAPFLVAQRVKGRLQHLIREQMPNAFRRNYGLRSVGSTRREKLERYLQAQLERHPMADPRVQEPLKKYQIHHPSVDLSVARHTSHAIYWYNLHLVVVNEERYREVRDEVLQGVRDAILRVGQERGHWLSRAAMVPDHIHLLLGCRLEESPEEVALTYLNSLAEACGRKAVFKPSYFVGTFSEYDLGVIPRV